jgi:acetyltransferase-like isoleucine patch superfamily enzyme
MGTLKALVGALASLRAWPLLLGYRLGALALGRQRAFASTSERVARIPGHWGVYVRQAFYRRTLAGCGRDVYFGFMSVFSKTEARVGDRVYIGRFCTIGLADLGDDVMLADAVQVLSGRHQHGSEAAGTEGQTLRDNQQVFSRVCVGRGAWLGAGSVVMADVGEGAVVGAGGVVVKPVPAGVKVGGVPAVPLRAAAAARA